MLTAFLLAALAQAPSMTLSVPTVGVPAATKADVWIYSEPRRQWLNAAVTPNTWVVDRPARGVAITAIANNVSLREASIPLLDPGVYRFEVYLVFPTSTNGGPVVDAPVKNALSHGALIVEPAAPPPVVTVTVTQPK